MPVRCRAGEAQLKTTAHELEADVSAHREREQQLELDIRDTRAEAAEERRRLKRQYEELQEREAVLMVEIETLKEAGKDKDQQVDEAWRKMSEFEKLILDLQQGCRPNR